MGFLTGVILSGAVYDMIKRGVSLTAGNVKKKLKGWIIDEPVAQAIEDELSKLQLSDESSEIAIERKIAGSEELTALVAAIKPNTSIDVVQNHYGVGDNVAGNKIIN